MWFCVKGKEGDSVLWNLVDYYKLISLNKSIFPLEEEGPDELFYNVPPSSEIDTS